MQRMTILGLNKKSLFLAKSLYKLLPDTRVNEVEGKLVVDAEFTLEDKEHITNEYNKTGNIVLFEDI